ncbi:MAG: hypothetical protein IGS54_20895 [Elainella sp. C42_A2020_010]|nr:hypothetical protein [Elainella sp. C42_A2020_010]
MDAAQRLWREVDLLDSVGGLRSISDAIAIPFRVFRDSDTAVARLLQYGTEQVTAFLRGGFNQFEGGLPTIEGLTDFAERFRRVSEVAEKLDANADVANALVQYPDALKPILEAGSNFLDRELVALQETGLSTPDVVHLLDLFEDVPLFRGTTDGFPGNPGTQELGISPASIDPLIATIFALEGKGITGNGIVLIATQRGLGNPVVDTGNFRRVLEREVQVGMLPLEFQNKALHSISVDRARQILSEMGVAELPNSIGTGDTSEYLRNTPRMTPEQIYEFVRRAIE